MVSQRGVVLTAITLYTLVVLYALSQGPQNVFSALRIGLKESTHSIRARLTRNGQSALLKANEELVHQLESPKARAAYLR